MNIFEDAFQYKLIYIFSSPVDTHRGFLKIGETTLTTSLRQKDLTPNCKELNRAATKRIGQYMNTAAISFKVLHTELAIKNNGKIFRDYDVHSVLDNSGFKRHDDGREWFKVDLNTAVKAIQAVKLGRKNLSGMKLTEKFIAINFRPEQEDAIARTVEYLKTGKDFLWNAKMRFGKTLCALEVVRRMNFNKTIIITHRPVVNSGWYDDFNKIFSDTDDYIYLTKDTKNIKNIKKKFVYFASMQDLRGSKEVGGKHNKNLSVFNEKWDFIIVDEAHEGTQTTRGDAVIKALLKNKKAKLLALSGTPFNIIDEFSDANTYNWDYVMEQRAKASYDARGISNPYADLPTMKIFTYNLGKVFSNENYFDVNEMAFKFSEFFRVADGQFVHADDVKSFLDLLVKPDDNNYPYSRADWRKIFRHTLWIIPGVDAGKALSKLLSQHKIFSGFEIVNVAGDGDGGNVEDISIVHDAIRKNDYTITLSCGRFTAGVTVPEWTAVFMLKGASGQNYKTSATSYLQTIFRVQSPCDKGGMVKQNCYVFDFAPDRTLRMMTEYVHVSSRPGKATDSDRKKLGELLNFCPVIALDGSEMKSFDAKKLFTRLKRVYAERIVKNGFDDRNLYNDKLLNLDKLAIDKFDKLKKIVGASKAQKKTADIVINAQGLDNDEYEEIGGKSKTPRTPEEKELAKRKQQRRDAISNLRAISIRMPLLIYGADIPLEKDFEIEMFLDDEIVDSASWAEFMPAGVTKEFFRGFIQYYDQENFLEAGRQIRQRTKAADNLPPAERIDKIVELFSTFKNPDKETVLTPWKVVTEHINSAFDDKFFTPDKKILEINSKSGLYILYVAYKIYRTRFCSNEKIFFDAAIARWDKTVAENVFVICKTPMAEKITRRTLLGYREGSVNAHYFNDLIPTLKKLPHIFIKRVSDENFWNKGVGIMKFDAVVGNPPYQVITDSDSTRMLPVYHLFMETAFKLANKVSLIHPARCLFNAGFTPQDFNQRLLNNSHLKIIRYEQDSTEFFPTSDIKGGVAITLYDKNQTFEPIKIFIPFTELQSIHQKVCVDNKNFSPLSEIILGQMTYRLSEKAYEDFPDLSKRVSERSDTALRTNAFEIMPDIFLTDKPNDGREYVQILGKVNAERVYKWVRRDYMVNKFGKWKVFVPASNGSGALGEVVSTPLVGLPLVGCTQTFITVGAFDTRAEADACIAYIRTKFCRCLLGILKVTQHNPPQTWAKVPLQDFTAASDIDWTLPIAEIDAQLYRKYDLTAAEINFIEEKVKAMS